MKTAKKTRRTLGLAIIMKDEVEDLDRIVKDYGSYFDKIYVTVTDKKTHTVLSKIFTAKPATASLVELSYFKWIDHFGKARIYNQRQVKTDYWMWLDTDDEIHGVERIPRLPEYMDTNDLNAVWFQYDYLQRVSLSDPGRILWRERIIKTASKFEWNDEAIHESVDTKGDIKQELLSDVMIKHRKTADQRVASGERNRLILEKEWHQTHRPITAYFIGSYLAESGDYEGAIEKLLFAAEHDVSKVRRFEAWQNLCECYYQIGQLGAALDAVSECMAIDPDHPEPWYQGFAVFKAMGHYDLAMRSAETAMTKHVKGELAILLGQDPSWYQYKGPFEVAQAYLLLGNVERAYELYQQVKKLAPEYIEEISEVTGVQWDIDFEQAHKDKFTSD